MADQNSKADAPVAEKVTEAVATDVPAKPDMKKIDAAVEAASKPKQKPAAKKAAPKKAKTPAAKKTSSKSTKTKEPKMATKQTKTTKNTATDQAKAMFADLSTRAQGAYDKTREYAGEAVEFSKGNVEAVVASGKILAEGVQGMAKGAVENGREAVSTMTADAKDYAAVRSPSELVQLNSKIASRNFDAMVAQTSKNVEAWTKLATEAFAPIQDRVSIAVEKARKVA
ncbi:phasin family protein [Blastomonas marina]|uniref:phasin family protein n=1 Tax=Blastomonas marina TaxID=1867408 RepID=UPI002AC950ED|nr:phasin family protein [Blastomonas marina]WPZ03133.1 phasin family protein [Blastomonas marina]